MITIRELAKKLNREEWAVERMLKNRGYLKKSGIPTKSCINAGYMNKNALITKSGESNFIDELGIKNGSDDEYDEYNDDWEEENSDEDDKELPEICSSYHGWSIWVEKDETHKFVITAVLENDEEYEIDRIEIPGDQIDENEDIETYITDKIDDREEEHADRRDWSDNYTDYMNLSDDWSDSYDLD